VGQRYHRVRVLCDQEHRRAGQSLEVSGSVDVGSRHRRCRAPQLLDAAHQPGRGERRSDAESERDPGQGGYP